MHQVRVLKKVIKIHLELCETLSSSFYSKALNPLSVLHLTRYLLQAQTAFEAFCLQFYQLKRKILSYFSLLSALLFTFTFIVFEAFSFSLSECVKYFS